MKVKSCSIPPSRFLAFTILEVLIAMAIFFMAIFSILQLVSQNLRAARTLSPMQVDGSSILAEMSLTNRLEEGPIPDIYVAHFNEMYPGYNASGNVIIPPLPEGTNGLFIVEIEISGPNKSDTSKMDVYMYKPLSQQGGKGALKFQ